MTSGLLRLKGYLHPIRLSRFDDRREGAWFEFEDPGLRAREGWHKNDILHVQAKQSAFWPAPPRILVYLDTQDIEFRLQSCMGSDGSSHNNDVGDLFAFPVAAMYNIETNPRMKGLVLERNSLHNFRRIGLYRHNIHTAWRDFEAWTFGVGHTIVEMI